MKTNSQQLALRSQKKLHAREMANSVNITQYDGAFRVFVEFADGLLDLIVLWDSSSLACLRAYSGGMQVSHVQAFPVEECSKEDTSTLMVSCKCYHQPGIFFVLFSVENVLFNHSCELVAEYTQLASAREALGPLYRSLSLLDRTYFFCTCIFSIPFKDLESHFPFLKSAWKALDRVFEAERYESHLTCHCPCKGLQKAATFTRHSLEKFLSPKNVSCYYYLITLVNILCLTHHIILNLTYHIILSIHCFAHHQFQPHYHHHP
ncbi:hypothetical protein SELMODRAFT_404537 [Selaginella moellendorffii]|uniref:Uncharacterized protein n=1 Tax=Selaginella moellendorffii TaxID=88036 RepID=D8QVN3_SELML|nr:hypothetical protein SELMODRAFT_404537 [Selaginella moellendorffii]